MDYTRVQEISTISMIPAVISYRIKAEVIKTLGHIVKIDLRVSPYQFEL